MKRVLSLILALSMVMSMFTFSFAGSSLKDIAGTEYEAAVEALIELGVVTGYPDGTYLPNKTVSRAEMAKLLVIAAGLEPAAEVSVGTTKFADVSADHWACGYINVASEYGYIAGYPDGNFKPDAEVKYSEAVTMALRVLGYRNVIEAKGTWPTNYIAKAQDLEMLDGITYGKYTDGAIRGNVAMLVWNMLKTVMWDVNAESEGDGLNYTTTEKAMLNIKFPDYAYSYATFEKFEITADAEVMITLGKSEDEPKTFTGTEFEYFGNDFYTFVEDTEVEVLVNEKDGVLLTIVPTGKDKLVEGTKAEIDDEYDSLTEADYDYVYARIEKKDAAASTQLEVSSKYIYKVEEKAGKYVKLNGTRYDLDDYDDVEIIIKDGERASISDIEVGDVLSTVEAEGEKFYIVTSSEVEGKLTKYTVEDYKDGSEYHEITVDGEKYILDEAATYVIDPEDEDEKQNKVFIDASSSDLEEMKNEEVVLYVDFLNRVARIDFDGDIEDEEEIEVGFYVITEVVEKESNGVYYIGLGNEEDEEGTKYYFHKSARELAQGMYSYDVDYVEGELWVVVFNDEGEILFMDIVAATAPDIEDIYFEEYLASESSEIVYGEDENEYFEVEFVQSGEYNDDKDIIEDGRQNRIADVDDSLVVISLVYDDKGTDEDWFDDEMYAIYEEGLEAIENLKDESILVITDAKDRIKTAKYIVRFEDNSSREDDLAGKLENVDENLVDGKYVTLTIDGEEILAKKEDVNSVEEYGAIVYSTKVDSNDNEVVTVIDAVSADELLSDDDGYVSYVTDKKVEFDFNTNYQFTLKEIVEDIFEGYLFVAVSVDPDAEDEEDVVLSVEAIMAEDLTIEDFAEEDRILKGSNKVLYIISGLEEMMDPEDVVHVDKVTLNSGDLALEVGEEATLVATVTPKDATYPEVTWSTSSGDVATVVDGKVTAVAPGTATITAKAGEETATCTVTVSAVVVAVESVELNKTTLALESGDTAELTATINPNNASETTVAWTSSKPEVASVVDGVVKAEGLGTATITATVGGKSATCEVEVTITATGLILDQETLSIAVGESGDLVPTVDPEGAPLTWKSSNTVIAVVDQTGHVTAKKEGTCTITVTAGEMEAECEVTVTAAQQQQPTQP